MAFLLATAVRKQREKGALFNSMLIHVVRYTKVQKEVAVQVELALKDIHQRETFSATLAGSIDI